MKNLKNIFKTGLTAAFMATITVACGDRPASNPTDDTSTSEAISGKSESTRNLIRPRPAPVGDTAETGEQADRFGNLPSNVDTAARRQVEQDILRQAEENPNQRPEIRTPPNRRIDGTNQ
ncbi:hypothetical protein [uncultured Pontibacter sp.]|uniref:hypothetical protein n=1 Tax=uncultured Pontibacter sp. TaxID=453356 RepID=UPI0026029C5C|nr:hypothetical protein [uncultured Pontibacter sp.]